ncbi:MAG TPA: hypothetical protein VD886_23730, partial [Herpetosiphonaceae bacterium]|nr:hypothetical protein [Herpetosiphonaceae bacterium]
MVSEAAPRRGPRRALRRIVTLLALLVVGYFGISAYIASQLTLTNRRDISANPAADGLPVEDVAFRSLRDDVTLRGWLLKAPADQG